jgi:hypothetical protein
MRRLALSLALSLLLLPTLCWAGTKNYLRITSEGGKGSDVRFVAKIGNKTYRGITTSPESIGSKDIPGTRWGIRLTTNPTKPLEQVRRASDVQIKNLLKGLKTMRPTDEVRTLQQFITTQLL